MSALSLLQLLARQRDDEIRLTGNEFRGQCR
jgi:hypothetical protein